MRLARKTVSVSFRDQVLEAYPILRDNAAYLRLTEYLMLGAYHDKESGFLILPCEVLAEAEGKQSAYRTKNYNGKRFLEAYSKDVAKVKWDPHNYDEGKARLVRSVDWLPSLSAALTAELESVWTRKGRVYFASGEVFTQKRQRIIRREEQAAAQCVQFQAGCEEARCLLDYLNCLPSNRFSKLLDNLPDAILAVQQLEGERKRMTAYRTLRAIRDQAQPFYKPVGKSVRIFSLNENFLRLNKEIRRVLTRDWVYFDLRAAQFAIVAKDWDALSLRDFLASGGHIWTELAGHLGLRLTPEEKGALKKALYSIAYGAGRRKIRQKLDLAIGEGIGQGFLEIPLIADLYEARRRQLRTVEAVRGARDCFGRWISNNNPRSVLAQLAQARELQLLWPVVDLARQTDEFALTMWLHDGFAVAFRDTSKAERWERRIVDAVNQRARDEDIYTQLDVSKEQ